MISRSERGGWIAAALLLSAPLAAQGTPAPADAARVHVVRPGDTLWDLARLYLNDPFLWPEIFRLNTGVVQDPARIYPAERLRIPGAAIQTAQAPAREGGDAELVFGQRAEQVREGAGLTIRAAGTADVPAVAPGDFYRAGFFADEREVAPLGRLAERLSPSVVPVVRSTMISLYDKVFVTLADPAAVSVGDRLHFFRPDRRLKPYGRLFRSTGMATVQAVDGNVATAEVDQLYDVLAPGDLALPVTPFPVPAGVAPAPGSGVEGRLIAFGQPDILPSTQDIAYVDVGEGAGVREGDEFLVFQPSVRERQFVRPEVPIARLQVVRVAGRTAAARVTELDYPALEPGLPVRLVAKMP